jgi:chromosome segregation ATPase
LVSLTRKAVLFQKKKHQAALLRRKGEREFKKAQFLAHRSASGLISLQRRIDSSKEKLEGVSGVLIQKSAQEESIQRLISDAEEKLRREKDSKSQTEQEIEFADSEEEKHRGISRLKIISERIEELQEEIKQRGRTFKKVAERIEDYQKSSSQLSNKIQKQTHSKPDLQQIIKTSKKKSIRFAKQMTSKAKQEESAKQNLSEINKQLSELAKKRKSPSKKKKRKVKSKKSNVKKKKSQRRKIKSKTKKKRSRVRKIKRKVSKKTKTRKIKRKAKVKRKSKLRKRRS